jgi:hypothetical protein
MRTSSHVAVLAVGVLMGCGAGSTATQGSTASASQGTGALRTHVCAREASLAWLDPAPVPSRGHMRALFPGDEIPDP